MNKKITKKQLTYIVLTLCLVITALLEFKFHRLFYFQRDDIWYGTNLVTGESLTSLLDIIEGQYWHYFNWGGRVFNHAVLQFTLMHGELFADVLNLIVTFSLSYLIISIAGKKDWRYFCLAFFMLISLNTDIHYSMFWQSGSANYLYSSNWILLFLLFYINFIKNPAKRQPMWLSLLMLPLGLVTGWSNENMGPACAITAFLAIFYGYKIAKTKVPLWMWIGSITASIGSVFLILAPGNFVRKATGTDTTLLETIGNRIYEMMAGGFSFLFPSLLFFLLFLYIYLKTGNQIKHYQVLIFVTALLSYGAMILSPTFPNRAAFGTMVLCFVLILSFLEGIETTESKYKHCLFPFTICMWIGSVLILYTAYKLPF